MTSASTDFFESPNHVDVWLELGREGRCFTYVDALQLGADIGDIVLVRLKGRPMHGLVMARRAASSPALKKNSEVHQENKYAHIEALIEVAAVDSEWREWLEDVAVSCYTSSFRMIKAALPPGWLGNKVATNFKKKQLWWVYLQSAPSSKESLSKRQLDLQEALWNNGGGAWQKDLQSKGFSFAIVQSLISCGIACRERRCFEQALEVEEEPLKVYEESQKLTDQQRLAIDVFNAQPPGKSLLLWGVTGSGKTEVYLQLAKKQLEMNKHCLILAPEIGLIPQLVDRFKARFGSRVFEYHSGCRDRERVRTWRECLRSSRPLIVVGTRSAVFLPLSPLGLIVLDEEHDNSYKQQSPMPCYHARQIALDRARRIGAKVVLGSATPALSTWKLLQEKGDMALARLTHRISSNSLPKVHVVDMREELAEGHRRLISRPLMHYLAALPEKKEQAVVLVPRRGYSSFLSCRSCGEVVQCPNCDVSLTVHRDAKGNELLRCHWCDYRCGITSRCQECGSNAFKPFGAGTQRVIEHLTKELEGLRLLRFDRDTTGGRDGHRLLLERFASGEADVLIGTQMLAKGIDLPRVTLAAVLAADGLLHRPDLHAGEQCLQLLMQLAGRAGRGELPGRVIVQTYCPDHPVILHLVDGRYEEFLKKESSLRKEAGLVPYSRACLLRVAGSSATQTANAAAILAQQLKPFCSSMGWSLIGPAPAMVAKVAGKSRWQILMHGPEKSELPLPEGNCLWEGLPKGVSLSVDPDPLEL